jgi:hypothetical protein
MGFRIINMNKREVKDKKEWSRVKKITTLVCAECGIKVKGISEAHVLTNLKIHEHSNRHKDIINALKHLKNIGKSNGKPTN